MRVYDLVDLLQCVSPQESLEFLPSVRSNAGFLFVAGRASCSYEETFKLRDIRCIAEEKESHLIPAVCVTVTEMLIQSSRQVGCFPCVVKTAGMVVEGIKPSAIIGLTKKLEKCWPLLPFK